MNNVIRILGFIAGCALIALSITITVLSGAKGPLWFAALAFLTTRLFITKLPNFHPTLWLIQLPALTAMVVLCFACAYLLFDLTRGVDTFISPLASLLLVIAVTSPVWGSIFVFYALVVGCFFWFWRKKQQTVQ